MSRDWDKLRRQDKAGRYDPIETFQSRRRKKRQPRFRAATPRREPPTALSKPVTRSIALRVETPNCVVGAVFKRHNGKWRCIKAAPAIEWMTKVRNMDSIHTWLKNSRFNYSWVTPNTGQVATHWPEDRPAEVTASHASPSSEVNTMPSLNNKNTAENSGPTPSRSVVLEQNGVKSPRCLIGSERSERLQTRSAATS